MNGDEHILQARFLVFDMEMTGLSPWDGDKIVEIATVPVDGLSVQRDDAFFVQLDPGRPVGVEAKRITGIRGRLLSNSPTIEEVLPDFIERLETGIPVGQSPALDMEFLLAAGKEVGVMPPEMDVLDILRIYCYLFPHANRFALDDIAHKLGIRGRSGEHSALEDALLTADIFVRLGRRLIKMGISHTNELVRIGGVQRK